MPPKIQVNLKVQKKKEIKTQKSRWNTQEDLTFLAFRATIGGARRMRGIIGGIARSMVAELIRRRGPSLVRRGSGGYSRCGGGEASHAKALLHRCHALSYPNSKELHPSSSSSRASRASAGVVPIGPAVRAPPRHRLRPQPEPTADVHVLSLSLSLRLEAS